MVMGYRIMISQKACHPTHPVHHQSLLWIMVFGYKVARDLKRLISNLMALDVKGLMFIFCIMIMIALRVRLIIILTM